VRSRTLASVIRERVDGASGAWPDGLERYLVLSLGECAVAGETGVDRRYTWRVPASSTSVLGIGRIVGEHVPECSTGPGGLSDRLQTIEQFWRVEHVRWCYR
jgi:hypothetical protein